MRSRPRAIGTRLLILSGLSAALAGCSTGGTQSMTTSSLAPRPNEGMVRDDARRYPDGSYAGRPYDGGAYNNGTYGRPYAGAPRRYVDPGEPTPREMAYGYGSPGHQSIQTGSLGPAPRAYDPNARWQPPAHVTTGSTGYGPHVIEVREGDTLYGLSRRYNVPMGDLVAANRLTSERIAVGQRLVIPTRYR